MNVPPGLAAEATADAAWRQVAVPGAGRLGAAESKQRRKDGGDTMCVCGWGGVGWGGVGGDTQRDTWTVQCKARQQQQLRPHGVEHASEETSAAASQGLRGDMGAKDVAAAGELPRLPLLPITALVPAADRQAGRAGQPKEQQAGRVSQAVVGQRGQGGSHLQDWHAAAAQHR